MKVYELTRYNRDGTLYSTQEKAETAYTKIEKSFHKAYEEAPVKFKEHYSKEEFLLEALDGWEIIEREVK